ncbi:MAG: hypothetical protein QOJ07_330, partial [Thermoleophilaceae bacterium]|nr:hypothetical protein [Thermoleophilaceae bacterium]
MASSPCGESAGACPPCSVDAARAMGIEAEILIDGNFVAGSA